MKIFLTGESGILGSDIKNQMELAGHEIVGFNSTNISISDYLDVKTKVNDFKPEIIIHCAAMTNVDLCEDDRRQAILTNVVASKNLAVAADNIGARIVYISSCGVYGNGQTHPHTEFDKTEPINYHHYTKLQGERSVKEHNNQFLIIRPGWLFGGTTTHRKNFVEARRKEASGKDTLVSAGDKFGSPTYTLDLAKQIRVLIEQEICGTFNMVNEGRASRYDYVSEIMSLFKLPVKVEKVDSNQFPRKANMPDNECLENFNLDIIGLNKMRGWKEALKDYINTTYADL